MEKFYREIMQIKDPALLQKLCEASTFVTVAKGKMLYRIGEHVQNVYFLKEGGLRGFYYNCRGREITDVFIYRPGETAMPCFNLASASNVSMVAFDDTVMVSVPMQKLMAIISDSFEGRDKYEAILVDAGDRHCRLKVQMYGSRVTERYLWFCENYPELVGRVSDRHVATFLNMNPVTLCRLRQELERGGGISKEKDPQEREEIAGSVG